jgi:hypothetical protein
MPASFAISGHGAATQPSSPVGAPPPFSLFKSGPFGSDPTVQIDGYPFGGDFAKEPLGFY